MQPASVTSYQVSLDQIIQYNSKLTLHISVQVSVLTLGPASYEDGVVVTKHLDSVGISPCGYGHIWKEAWGLGQF